MAQTIKLKRSATAGNIPSTSNIELGEVAINTTDGKLFIKRSVGGTESIVEVGGTGSFLPLSGGSLTGGLSGTTASFSGAITATKANVGTSTANYSGTDLTVGGNADSQNGLAIQTSTSGIGYILFGDGSGASAYRGEINYSHSTDSMALKTAGAARVTINSSGIDVTGSVVADGLTVNGTGSVIELSQSATGSATYYTMDNTVETGGKRWRFGYSGGSSDKGSFSFYNQTDNNLALLLASSGATFSGSVTSTGLNVTSNTPVLSFIESDQGNRQYQVGSFGGAYAVYDSTNSQFRHVIDNSGNNIFNTGGVDADFRVESDGNDHMLFVDGGKNQVGIGTGSTNAKLEIGGVGAGEQAFLITSPRNDALSNGLARINLTDSVCPFTALQIDHAGTGLALDVNGKSEFSGDLTLTSKLTLTKSPVGNYSIEVDGTNTGQPNFIVKQSTSERLRIDNVGNVIVSGTAAGQATSVALHNTGYVHAVSSHQMAGIFDRRDSDGDILLLRKQGSTAGSLGTLSGDLYLGTGNTTLTFTDGSRDIMPTGTNGAQASDVISLGNANNRFKDLSLSGTANVGVLAVDTMTLNASSITGSSNLTLDCAGDINLDAAGNDIKLKANGTTFGQLTNDSGQLIIYNAGSQMLRGNSGANALFQGNLHIPNGSLMVGATTAPTETLTLDKSSGNVFQRFDKSGTIKGLIGVADGSAQGSSAAVQGDMIIRGQTNLLLDTAGTTRVKVDSSGNATFSGDVSVPNISVADDIRHSGDSDTYISFEANNQTFYAGGTRGLDIAAGSVVFNEGGGDVDFRVESASGKTHALFVEGSSGNVLVGTTDAELHAQSSATGAVITSGGVLSGAANGTVGLFNRINGSGDIVAFFNAGDYVGSISGSSSATSYNTSSDQRLKENIADADDSGTKVDAIQVRKFDWKADGSHQDYGMIAQELQAVAPEAVSAPENPDEMMGVDYSKLVPMLIKEIQSLRQRVASLEE